MGIGWHFAPQNRGETVTLSIKWVGFCLPEPWPSYGFLAFVRPNVHERGCKYVRTSPQVSPGCVMGWELGLGVFTQKAQCTVRISSLSHGFQNGPRSHGTTQVTLDIATSASLLSTFCVKIRRDASKRPAWVRVCVFYYCRTYYKAVRVGGGGEWRTCAMRDDKLRPVWMSLPITH